MDAVKYASAKQQSGEERTKIRILLLPKFPKSNVDESSTGEGDMLYDEYCRGGNIFDIAGSLRDSRLYEKNGIALYMTGIGKVNAAISLTSLLNDNRFDFSEMYMISVGCAGSAVGYGTMGDVYIITAVCDYDLGHKADARDMKDHSRITTWYHDKNYDSSSFKMLNEDLTERIYSLTKNIPLKTTERTRGIMAREFEDAEWAVRDPMVLKGTTVTGDNYWKGLYDHANAELIVKTYNCPDPYATTEMEDIALANVADRYGFLDRFLIIRTSVNTDVFMNGDSPETLLGKCRKPVNVSGNRESSDIFHTSMENEYRVVKTVVDYLSRDTR